MKEDALCTSSTRPVDINTMSVEKTQKACKAVCIKDMIIQRLTHSVTITQLDLYFHCTNDSFSFTPFISPDNHLSIPHTLTSSRTQSPLSTHIHTHTLPFSLNHNTLTLPRLFLIGLSMMKTGQPGHLIGLCREIPGKPLPSFMFI